MPNSFAQTKCAVKLASAAKGIISDSDLQNLFSAIDARKNEGQVENIAKDAAQKFVDQKQYQAFRDKSTAIFNARAYKGRMEPTVKGWIKKGMAPHKALEAYTLGSSGDPGIGTRDNPATQRDHLQQRQKNIILTNLKNEKLDSYALDKNHVFDQAILEAREYANTPDADHKGALPMSDFRKLRPDQQTAVSRVAQMFNEQDKELQGQLAQEGAFPQQPEGYMGEQSHDRMKIRNASRSGQMTMTDRATEADRATYTKDLSKWLDMEGTRGNLVRLGRMGILEDLNPERFNDSLWDVFATGIRKEPRGEGLSGQSGNIAAEAEKARILEFKDAASFNAYNKKYGSGSVWQSHLDQIDHMAHQIMTLRYFGPSAESNFQKLVDSTGVDLRNKLDAVRNPKSEPTVTVDQTERQAPVKGITQENWKKYQKLTPVKATTQFIGKSIKEIREWAKSKITGKYHVDALGADVSIAAGGIKKSLSGSRAFMPQHLEAISALPDLLKKGVLINKESPRIARPGLVAFHYLLAPLEVDGKNFDVRLVVKEQTDGHFQYDHALIKNKSQPQSLTGGAPQKEGLSLPETAAGQSQSNPYASLSQEDRSALTNQTLKQADQLKNSRANDYMDAYLGITKSPGNMTQARIVDNIMSIQRMGLLGSSIFSQLSALFPAFLQSRYAGVGLLQSAFGPLFTALGRMGKEDLQNFIRRQGVGMEGMLGHLHSSLIGNDYTPGAVMKNLEAKFFKGVGLTKWNDVLAASHVMAVSNEMAHNAGLKFEELPFAIRRHLGDYNISPKEWDLVRKYAPTKFNDYDVMASDKLRGIPDAEMNAATGKSTAFAARSSRLDLEAKLGNLFQDSSDYARVQHDLKTSQLIPHGIRGTLGGDALRLTMQFATFNFAHGQRVLQRQWKSSSFPEFLFKTLGGLTMTGTLAYSLRQLAAGRNPMADDTLWNGSDKVKQTEAWGKLLAAGAGQAGVGAMLGDLLFSQTYDNGRGSSALQPILGPTGDDLTQLMQFGHDAMLKGKLDSDQMLKFAQGHTPFANIWWIKPFINYGLMYGLEEQLNPGVLKRMEQSSKKAGDPYWLPPTQFSNQF